MAEDRSFNMGLKQEQDYELSMGQRKGHHWKAQSFAAKN